MAKYLLHQQISINSVCGQSTDDIDCPIVTSAVTPSATLDPTPLASPSPLPPPPQQQQQQQQPFIDLADLMNHIGHEQGALQTTPTAVAAPTAAAMSAVPEFTSTFVHGLDSEPSPRSIPSVMSNSNFIIGNESMVSHKLGYNCTYPSPTTI